MSKQQHVKKQRAIKSTAEINIESKRDHDLFLYEQIGTGEHGDHTFTLGKSGDCFFLWVENKKTKARTQATVSAEVLAQAMLAAAVKIEQQKF